MMVKMQIKKKFLQYTMIPKETAVYDINRIQSCLCCIKNSLPAFTRQKSSEYFTISHGLLFRLLS